MTDGSQRLVIVADDLTGAADAAAAFARRVSTAVHLQGADPLPVHPVVAVDTDSRHLAPVEAATVVRAAATDALHAGAQLYKKIDSTLRGNVAVEVGATLDALAATAADPCAVVAPAFPATGRTVRGGVVRVDGEPLAFRHAGGDVRRLLCAAKLPTAVVELDVVRGGVAELTAALGQARRAGVRAICVDAETDDDLHVVADAIDAMPPGIVAVGSAGLARVIAAGWRAVPADPVAGDGAPTSQRAAVASGAPPAHADRPPAPRMGPVLLAVGSYSAPARAQREALADEVIRVSIDEPFGPDETERAGRLLDQALGTGDAVLTPDPASPVNRSRAAEVATALAGLVGRRLTGSHPPLAGVVLTGGETARAVLRTAGVSAVIIDGELEPGVVAARLGHDGSLPLVTKAGAFGDAGTLERIRVALHQPGEVDPRAAVTGPVSTS